ncbi:GNAT family N-acetyltransferase [Anaeroselena agilis]|uniref:GNAT family N-acetyltransferase n=1 Tax=Anaeroselena agilis TaxID=3063788 RepID=A0ABU3P0R4_9FIRM|nr:GNAT family N-acetyltransferase [Selenomonadales bacterium 4137-cl]
MALKHDGYVFSRDKSLLSLDRVADLLARTYWAGNRGRDKILTSIDNSLCFGIYKDGHQVGFARAVTDYATVWWLADVVIDEAHRGKGLAKILIRYVTETEELRGVRGILITRDAHGLYEHFGFARDGQMFMMKNG